MLHGQVSFSKSNKDLAILLKAKNSQH